MLYLKLIMMSAIAILALSACGGGGDSGPGAPVYNGLTTPVNVTSTNAQGLATKATIAAEETLSQDAAQSLGDQLPFKPSNPSNLDAIAVDIARTVANRARVNLNIPMAATYTSTDLGGYPFCGGSISFPDNFGDGGMLNGSITFNSLCYADATLGQVTISGTITYSENSTSFTIRYVNFRISGGGETATVNMTISCDSEFNCSVTSDFSGSDGKIYRIADFTVSGSGTGPYSINATFYHPDYGSSTISGTGLNYNCSNGYPDSGTITITGAAGSSATINFTSCAGYSGTWNDGVSSGSFSGTW